MHDPEHAKHVLFLFESWTEFAIFYAGGMLVGIFGNLIGKPEYIAHPRFFRLCRVLSVLLWPLLLPLSFFALWLIFLTVSLHASLWLVHKVGGTFEWNGRRVRLTFNGV